MLDTIHPIYVKGPPALRIDKMRSMPACLGRESGAYGPAFDLLTAITPIDDLTYQVP